MAEFSVKKEEHEENDSIELVDWTTKEVTHSGRLVKSEPDSETNSSHSFEFISTGAIKQEPAVGCWVHNTREVGAGAIRVRSREQLQAKYGLLDRNCRREVATERMASLGLGGESYNSNNSLSGVCTLTMSEIPEEIGHERICMVCIPESNEVSHQSASLRSALPIASDAIQNNESAGTTDPLLVQDSKDDSTAMPKHMRDLHLTNGSCQSGVTSDVVEPCVSNRRKRRLSLFRRKLYQQSVRREMAASSAQARHDLALLQNELLKKNMENRTEVLKQKLVIQKLKEEKFKLEMEIMNREQQIIHKIG